jgi:ubiquinone/menaquinone biosynthesis C-methylase UbiE
MLNIGTRHRTVKYGEQMAGDLEAQNEKRRRAWAKQASSYDRQIGWFERKVFGGRQHRTWACRQASGDVLEVAVGTGLNLPEYPLDTRVTGIDLSPEMVELARRRISLSGHHMDLRTGDAQDLAFDDASFDVVVCTYSLCNIPDPALAIAEMRRVLRPGGRLILVDHVGSTSRLVYGLQKVIEPLSVRFDGDWLTRRPSVEVHRQGFDVVEQERHGFAGIVERLVALKS